MDVYVLGHIMPVVGQWLPGFYTRYQRLVQAYSATISAQLYGHVHNDEWVITRECASGPSPQPYEVS
jgi:hypothetical protein